jgi:hypothetical protein
MFVAGAGFGWLGSVFAAAVQSSLSGRTSLRAGKRRVIVRYRIAIR